MPLKIGIPAKGRIQSEAISWMETVGMHVVRSKNSREYSARVRGIENLELVLLSASDMPSELSTGSIDLGITGIDMMRERVPNWQLKATELRKLGFGKADLLVAVPRVWVDADTLHDLDEVAAQFRRTHGWRLRIATKYHNLTREFLSLNGVADYQLVDSKGATEGTVANQSAEAISDIVSTGETLKANGLKPLADGVILKSEAALFLSTEKRLSAAGRDVLAEIKKRIGGFTAATNAP